MPIPGRRPLRYLQRKSSGEMIETIIEKFKKLEEKYDFTVIEGSDFTGDGIAFEFETNATIAKNLSAPVIIVISGQNKTTAQTVNTTLTVFQNFEAREMQVLAVVVNKVNPDNVK